MTEETEGLNVEEIKDESTKKRFAVTRESNTERRNRAIKERYNDLYNKERTRHDDCLDTLSQEFFLSIKTISRIIVS
jgi:hypothetical protein